MHHIIGVLIMNIDFIEFCAENVTDIDSLLSSMKFKKTYINLDNTIAVFQQGEIVIIVNAKKNTHAHYYFKKHGSSICSIGIRAREKSYLNRSEYFGLPSMQGIGGTIFYITNENSLQLIMKDMKQVGDNDIGIFTKIDHIAYCAYQGRSLYWEKNISAIFDMRNVMDFSIAGKHTSFNSRGIINSDNSQRFVISESNDSKSQIADYLREHRGEGIQHIAFSSSNITNSVSTLKNLGVEFVSIPASYYDNINNRIPQHDEDISLLKENNILIDSDKNSSDSILLQTFTKNLLGPLFFEVIERKGNQGFGEGNITALFEAVEREQILRGSLVINDLKKGKMIHE